jgi:zinc transport system substrate-binding protein
MPVSMRPAYVRLLVGALATTGCSAPQPTSEPADAERTVLRVAVVNYPLAYLAERIGGGEVEVWFDAPADVDPAFWRPAPETVVRYQRADLILDNGAGYAAWMRTATLPASHIVDTSAAFTDRLIDQPDPVIHTHGPEGEHEHGGFAFTTWIDPMLAILHAEAIRDAMSEQLPERAGVFAANFKALERDLREIDIRLDAAVAQAPDRPLLFSHPVYDYLIRRYGISGHSVHWEPDETPGTEQWRELEQLAEEHDVQVMVWEGDPLPSTVDELQTRGIRSVVFDPCANRPATGDLLSVLSANADALAAAYQ